MAIARLVVSADPPPERARPGDPEYGPGGYLPSKAAGRARKIVLRAPLGIGWIVASVVLAVVIAVVGIVYFTR